MKILEKIPKQCVKMSLNREIDRIIENNPDHQMKIHYEELYNTAIWELKVSWLYVEHLLSIINEIKSLNKDVLIEAIIDNWLHRHNIDKLIHARVLFD